MTLARALKLHLRVLAIHGRNLRVVTLRPTTPVRFSTNYYHDTWHILADRDGAALLGRLLWGLAFQRHAGTLILIDHDHLVPTPFEADPPDPILVIPDGLTRIDDDALRALKLRLRRAPGPPTTIRWHTFGMIGALARADADTRRWHPWWPDPRRRVLRTRERMARRAGFVCFTAPAALLRDHALAMHRMGDDGYYPLALRDSRVTFHHDGELQTISGFADAVAAACVARRELCGDARATLASEAEREAIYAGKHRALTRRLAARRRR